MNILICSAGRRVKLVEYFKEELQQVNGKVIAIDCDPTAAALYAADAFEIVPRIDHIEYISILKDLCRKYEINGILSLIDPELTILASVKEEFEQEGIRLIVSDEDVIEICFDKEQTYQCLQANGLPSVPTYTKLDDVKKEIESGKLSFPLIAKPKNGSASIGIRKIVNMEEIEVLPENDQDIVIQPFIDGEEYGVDCYVDLITKETTNIFIKRKLRMRAGETDKSIAVKDPEVRSLIEKLTNALEFVGPIDVDCFRTSSGVIISEINPRFGGGYPHAHEMGQNFVRNLLNNLAGNINCKNAGDYQEGTTMIKYDQLKII